ncbi:poly-gamma-glutamate hydrolase family protein [Streptomyces candidus]|uniref:Phage replication-related protein YjqB (UPF0714/DUF867 family) n=1 Tax=Streptomyces candidus TaxID=67283 RepID=A0A7X0HEF0_9ACTN|nr:poly-gamma-glutamate hydrolase family protein [Streptomyces candidus]MBB6436090.1 phage replication-related protein YjqB (UPF0714/DUF867 family) [Streptomyces candidus]GHH43580.1 hypothetical protein GCM10018773_29940 [Streptomyces candidus]
MPGLHTNRRTLLSTLTAAVVGAPLLSTLATRPAVAAVGDDVYASNTELYRGVVEGKDFARRFKRHEMSDNVKTTTPGPRLTTIMALHGGGIEMGTSELCLGTAGYRPDTLAPLDPGAPLFDYWMLEGLRTSNNGELHVTASHCDDPTARSMAAASANVLSFHGCTAAQAGAPASRPEAVVVGGLNARLRTLLSENLRGAGFQIITSNPEDLNGDLPHNICNRTLTGEGGGQLELTTELRASLFDNFSGAANRASTFNAQFLKFTTACRTALTRMETEQLARPSLFAH